MNDGKPSDATKGNRIMHDKIDEMFTLEGIVVAGDQRGRQIGFPTANIIAKAAGDSKASIYTDGVYVTLFERLDHTRLLATTSIGHRPTFYEKDAVRLIETHVLDFDGELYGEFVRIYFLHRLRPQRTFDGVAELTLQLERDIADTRVWANNVWQDTSPLVLVSCGELPEAGECGGKVEESREVFTAALVANGQTSVTSARQ